MMKISCILLAAGTSSRMRGKNKLLLKVDEKSLIRKTLEEVKKLPFFEVIVVTGFDNEKIMNELHDLSPRFVHNPDFEKGMHSSIKSAVKSLSPDSEGFFVCLGDQPYFDHKNLKELLKISSQDKNHQVFCPTFEGQRGHPVLLSSTFIPEILQEPDGDYGLAYLLKRHKEAVLEVPIASRNILLDIDQPLDYEKVLSWSYDSMDPIEEFHAFIQKLRSERKTFAIATVIEVMGSASARTGSKAIFNDEGKNLLGWVGGGCAERFIGEESVIAIKEKKTRIILADLDDEIFGLGVACGGKMRIFIEPVFPAETVLLPDTPQFSHEIRALSGFYGWNVKKAPEVQAPQTIEDLLLTMCGAVASQRGRSNRSMRLVKEVPAKFLNGTTKKTKFVTIVGRTRITEALARHFTLLSYSVRAIGPDLKQEDYPSEVQCSCLDDSYDNISFREGEVVVIASHTSQDPSLVKKALDEKASHVAMIGSYKRSLEVLTYLDLLNKEMECPLYVPAGLDIDAKNPDEIALSVVAEVIAESRRGP